MPFVPNWHLSPRIAQPPLATAIAAYIALLSEQGYAAGTTEMHICFLADLNEWFARRGLRLGQLTEENLHEYLVYRHRRHRSWVDEQSVLKRFLDLLHDRGLLKRPPSPSPHLSPRGQVQADFDRYLAEERALAPATRLNYGGFVRDFLQDRFPHGPVCAGKLQAVDITNFVRRQAPGISPHRAGLLVTALRSFLRYLQQRGAITHNLAAVVPTIASWSLAPLPKYLHPAEIRQVLRQCDRRKAQGRRDFAILLLLARLGLRACEVVSLCLEDIDWRAGAITVTGKRGRVSRLPLPSDVGEAIAAYLQRGRPPCTTRRVFVRARAPRSGFANSEAISTIVARRLHQAGITSPATGAHLFRHTLATEMLRRGGSLADIAQVLRHESFNTTQIYAKVDLPALRPLAKPWPDHHHQHHHRGGRP